MVVNYTEAARDFPNLLNTALTNDVFINWRNGIQFKVIPVKNNADFSASPFEKVKGVNTNITMKDIVDVIREGREER